MLLTIMAVSNSHAASVHMADPSPFSVLPTSPHGNRVIALIEVRTLARVLARDLDVAFAAARTHDPDIVLGRVSANVFALDRALNRALALIFHRG